MHLKGQWTIEGSKTAEKLFDVVTFKLTDIISKIKIAKLVDQRGFCSNFVFQTITTTLKVITTRWTLSMSALRRRCQMEE